MNQSINLRLARYIELKGLSVRAIEVKAGITNGLLGRFLKGTNPSFGIDKVEAILKSQVDLNPTWLLLGEEQMERSKGGEGMRVTQTAIGNGNRQEVRVADLEARIQSLEGLVSSKDKVIRLLEEKIETLQSQLSKSQ